MKRKILKTERHEKNRHVVTVTLDCGHTLKLNSNNRVAMGKVWCWKCARPGSQNPAPPR
jgi:hypothetical protein